MAMIKFILLILALVFFILAALDIRPPRVNPGWLGLAFWVSSLIIS